MSRAATLHTIGHSTRELKEFVDLLRDNGITRLVDVRRFPGSRRHPHFNDDALAESLPAEGIAYRHEPALGGRRKASDDSPNGGWRNASFQAYADYLSSPEALAALDRLEDEARRSSEEGGVAVMCAEAVPWRCHRRLISDAMVVRDVDVRHIISSTNVDEHTLNPMARVSEGGLITYPPAPPEQPELF